MNTRESTGAYPNAQPPNEPQHVSVSAKQLIVDCARESFDAQTLRDLSVAFARLADEKDGEA